MQTKDRVLAAMGEELRLQKSYLTVPEYPHMTCGQMRSRPDTLYFGGGSPSLLTAAELETLFSRIHKYYCLPSDAEITIEANPDDIATPLLQAWRHLGVNRVSLGIQSFSDELLRKLNRIHNSQIAWSSLEKIRSFPLENVSIDLIYGIPGLEDDAWLSELKRIAAAGIPHISCYALTVEPRTALSLMIQKKRFEEPNQDQAARQFLLMIDFLESEGYEHYEISNFAKPGWRSRHNSQYWQGAFYLGVGPSAHSFDGDSRQWNISSNVRYVQQIQHGSVPFQREVLSPSMRYNEYIMTSLRTMEGCDPAFVQQQFGAERKETLLSLSSRYLDENLLTWNMEHLILTRKGKLYADGIAANLFA